MTIDLIIDLTLITFIIVYIIDFSGFTIDISKKVFKVFNPGKIYTFQLMKPFSCSLCMTFWTIVTYCICSDYSILISLAYATFFGGFITVIINKIIRLFFEIINKI